MTKKKTFKRYIPYDAEQRSPSWFFMRKGKVTASNYSSVSKVLKNGNPSKERDTLMYEKTAERLTKCGYKSSDLPNPLDWGTETEKYAFDIYKEILAKQGLELRPSVLTVPIGLEDIAASPDGQIHDKDGNLVALLEIKCPTTKTHLSYIIEDDNAPSEYHPQMLLQMAIFDMDTVHFLSFDPRLSGETCLVIRQFHSTAEQREETREKCRCFISDVNNLEMDVITHTERFYSYFSQYMQLPRREVKDIIDRGRAKFVRESIYGKFVENRAEIEHLTENCPTQSALQIHDYNQFKEQKNRQEILLEIVKNN